MGKMLMKMMELLNKLSPRLRKQLKKGVIACGCNAISWSNKKIRNVLPNLRTLRTKCELLKLDFLELWTNLMKS